MNRVYPTVVEAGSSLTLGVVGTGFKVIECQAAGVVASYASEAGAFDIPLVLGREFVAGFRFNEIRLSNETAQDVALSLFVGLGRLEDDSLVGEVSVSEIKESVSVSEIKERVDISAAGGAVVALDDVTIPNGGNWTVPANSLRKELHIGTDQNIRYGAGAGSGKGKRLEAGVSAVFELSGELYIHNGSGQTAVLTMSEVLQ